MRFIGREARPWFGGVISVVAGAAVLLVMLSAPSLKYAAVECVNTALAYPEKPALYVRNIVKLSGNWVLERATLNERVERLELERQALAEALQRAGAVSAAPRESYVRAVVTLRYPQDWWQEFRIDKGTRDGVGRLNLLYIPEERRLSRGMTVSTSLMNDLIPPGLPIGTIIGVDKNKEGYTEMKLSAGAHLTQLYNVEVFTGKGAKAK